MAFVFGKKVQPQDNELATLFATPVCLNIPEPKLHKNGGKSEKKAKKKSSEMEPLQLIQDAAESSDEEQV